MGLLLQKFKPILEYYLLQKKVKENLRNENTKDNNNIEKAYYINPDYIKEWKKSIGYISICKHLDTFNIKDNKLNKQQINFLEEYKKKNEISFHSLDSFNIKTQNFVPMHEIIINEEILENLMNSKFKLKKRDFEEINYIFKKQMIIFLFYKYKIIKILIHSLPQYKEIHKLINLKFIFNDKCQFDLMKFYLIDKNSIDIINFLLIMNIFEIPEYTHRNKNDPNIIKFTLINEEKNQMENNQGVNDNNIIEIQNKNCSDEIKKNGDIMSQNISNFNDEVFNIDYTITNILNNEKNGYNNQNIINLNKVNNFNDIIINNKVSEINGNNMNYSYLKLNNKIYQLENLLNQERFKNKELILKNNNLVNELQIKNNNENNLNKKIYKLKEENNKIKSNLTEISLNQLLPGEKILAILIYSVDRKINKPIACKNTVIFVEIEEKLFNEFPILKESNKIYSVNGAKIEPKLSLEKNKIKDGDLILVQFLDE